MQVGIYAVSYGMSSAGDMEARALGIGGLEARNWQSRVIHAGAGRLDPQAASRSRVPVRICYRSCTGTEVLLHYQILISRTLTSD
jgi:hypothetical protein